MAKAVMGVVRSRGEGVPDDQANPMNRHSKHAWSEAEHVIRNPAFSRRVQQVAAKAGFQIAHFAALRFGFGMTGFVECHRNQKGISPSASSPGEYPKGEGVSDAERLMRASPEQIPPPGFAVLPRPQEAEGEKGRVAFTF